MSSQNLSMENEYKTTLKGKIISKCLQKKPTKTKKKRSNQKNNDALYH